MRAREEESGSAASGAAAAAGSASVPVERRATPRDASPTPDDEKGDDPDGSGGSHAPRTIKFRAASRSGLRRRLQGAGAAAASFGVPRLGT